MKPRLHACLLAICSLVATVAALGHFAALRFEDAFVFTFIDAPYEQEFGGPPFDRSLYAKVIDQCRALGAKGVVIKFFLDREQAGPGDEILAQSMKRLPVILQARIDPGTGLPDEIADKFSFQSTGRPTRLTGDRGWIPLAKLAAVAADVGFVDFADEHIPLLETYRGKTYRSIVVSALELQSGAKAKLNPAGVLLLGDRRFPADSTYTQSVVRSEAPLPSCQLGDLLSGKVDPALVRGRVVVLCYTGKDGPVLSTSSGSIAAHVFFGQCLRAVFESINAEPR